MAVSKRLRYEVLLRDNHTCRYCGGTAPDVKITVDHVVPVALGGADSADNLVAACHDCNAGKSSTTADSALIADVAQDALRWEAVVRAASQQLREQRGQRESFARDAWNAWNEWCGHWSSPKNAFGTFEQWYDRGVTVDDVKYASLATCEAFNVMYHWAYFCGIINKLLRQRDELARQMLDAERGEG